MDQERADTNDNRDWENIEFTSSSSTAIVEYTINTGTGTDTDTVKYLNKGSLGTGFVLRPSATVTITQIGNKVFRNPITIETGGFSVSKHIRDFSLIKIKTTEKSTIIRLLTT